MNPLAAKPLRELTIADIKRLIDEEWVEDSSLEFKRELPGSDSSTKWHQNKTLTLEAREKLLKEVVAFANGLGGDLVIGLAETDDKPHRAREIVPIANCHELAEILRRCIRSTIREPSIDFVESCGIPRESGSADGVVVIRVPQSLSAPHRIDLSKSEFNFKSYLRRSDEAVEMTMREVQELTLERSTLFDRIDRHFDDARSRFDRELTDWIGTAGLPAIGYAFHAHPLLPQMNFREEVLRVVDAPTDIRQVLFVQRDAHRERLASFSYPGYQYRPVLRGMAARDTTSRERSESSILYSGSVSLSCFELMRDGELRLCADHFLGMLAAGLSLVGALRRPRLPDLPFAFQMSLEIRGARCALPWIEAPRGRWHEPGHFETEPVAFPRLVLGPDPDLSRILTTCAEDLYNAAGDVWPPEVRITVE